MLRNSLLSSAAAIVISTSAYAADLPTKKAPIYDPAPIFTWTGFYAGATVGYLGVDTKATTLESYNSNVKTGTGNKSSTNGAVVGGTLGYNYQMGSIVLGLEGDFSVATGSTSSGIGEYVTTDTKLNSFGTLRARLGYAIGQTLIYATGGLAVASLSQKAFLYYDCPGCRGGFSKMKTGWTLGGGIEQAVSKNVSVKLEALYADFGKTNVANSYGCRWGFKNTATVVRAGVNYKF